MKQYMIVIISVCCLFMNSLSASSSQHLFSSSALPTQVVAKETGLNKREAKRELRQLKKQARQQNPEVMAKTAKNLGIASMVCIVTGMLLPVGIILMIIAVKKARQVEQIIYSDSSDQHREAYANAKVGKNFAYFSLGYLGFVAAFLAAVFAF